MPQVTDPELLQMLNSGSGSGPVYGPPPEPEKPREAPQGYEWDGSGGMRPISGGPADKGNAPEKAPQGYRWVGNDLEPIPGGPADTARQGSTGFVIPDGTAKRAEGNVGTYVGLQRSLDTFRDNFGGNWAGSVENWLQQYLPVGTDGQREWWANFKSLDNQIRNDLFGSALTATEKASYQQTTIEPGMRPEVIRENLKQRAQVVKDALDRQRKFMLTNGYKPAAVDALFEPILEQQAALAANVGMASGDATPQGDGPYAAIPSRNGDGGFESAFGPVDPYDNLTDNDRASPLPDKLLSEGKRIMSGEPPRYGSEPDTAYQRAGSTRRVQDGELAGQVEAMVRGGSTLSEINGFVEERGGQPINPGQYFAVRKFLQKNPDYAGSLVDAWRTEDVPTAERLITEFGDNAVGAYLLGAGQMLSGNTLDNLAPDPEAARLALQMGREQNPMATTAGEITGGALASMIGEAGLARLGMAPGLARGAVADAAMGSATGTGAADDGNRLEGAVMGAAAGAAGGAAGSLGTRAVTKALNPSGGPMRPLYDAGVRPTPGQRFADSGRAGAALNKAEEALQSVPLVGSAIRGAREQARDQFQIGAFNEALKEIGEQLPKGTKPGTASHKFAQEAFDRVYDKARSGMVVREDNQFVSDLAALDGEVRLLAEQSSKRFDRIFQNVVASRVDTTTGEISGSTYKTVISDMGKQIRSIRNSKNGDGELANTLEDLQRVLDNAARRHSDPAAVELLDAADAGYAKLVRIEDAAARRGGDQGEFSPSQFDASVQRNSGGRRSRAFLRGDALMQDYAAAGRSLEDKLSSEGAGRRDMIGVAATGGMGLGTAAGVVSPAIASFLAAIGTAYAPGLRRATTGAFAPGKLRSRIIARQLEKRTQLLGRVGAAGGAAFSSETADAQ